MFFSKFRFPQAVHDEASSHSSLEALKENPIFFLPKGYINANFFSGPESFYENEAWAPETPQIRLFSKKQTAPKENS